jgi:hypothetical protein
MARRRGALENVSDFTLQIGYLYAFTDAAARGFWGHMGNASLVWPARLDNRYQWASNDNRFCEWVLWVMLLKRFSSSNQTFKRKDTEKRRSENLFFQTTEKSGQFRSLGRVVDSLSEGLSQGIAGIETKSSLQGSKSSEKPANRHYRCRRPTGAKTLRNREDGLGESRKGNWMDLLRKVFNPRASNGGSGSGSSKHSIRLRKTVPGRQQFIQLSATVEGRKRGKSPW